MSIARSSHRLRLFPSHCHPISLSERAVSGTGTWDAGTTGRGTRGAGRGDSKTLGLGDVGPTGLEDVINKQHLIFSLNLLSTIFGASEKGIICWRVCQQTSS